MSASASLAGEGRATEETAPDAVRPAAIWMVSPAFDLVFFVATALVVVFPWLAIEHYSVEPFVVLAVVAVASNAPHLMSTWTRVYLDGNERLKRPVAYYVVPLLLAAFAAYFIVHEGRASSTLRSVLLYWAFWHFLAQNWGILRIYQRRAGDVGTWMSRLERVVLYACAAWALLHRIHFGPWALFGAIVWHPAYPEAVVDAAFGLMIGLASLYVVLRGAQLARGKRLDVIRPLFLLANWFGFFVPFVLIKNSGTAAFAAAACWHGLQYLGIVWYYNRNRWKGGIDSRAKLVSWVSQPGRAHWYFATLLGLAGIVYGIINVIGLFVLDAKIIGAMTWLALTFGHYWLDGVIWKLRKPELAKHLVRTA